MNIKKIGSQVTLVDTRYSGRFNKSFVQVFRVLDVNKLKGWKTHSFCAHMFATSSHLLGVYW